MYYINYFRCPFDEFDEMREMQHPYVAPHVTQHPYVAPHVIQHPYVAPHVTQHQYQYQQPYVPQYGVPSGPPPSITVSPEESTAGTENLCTGQFVYLWLIDGQNFWAWITDIVETTVYGFYWNNGWVRLLITLDKIDGFYCYSYAEPYGTQYPYGAQQHYGNQKPSETQQHYGNQKPSGTQKSSETQKPSGTK
jgi:hypothetical protein